MKTVIKIILIVLLLGICVTAVAFAVKGEKSEQQTIAVGYTDEDLQKSYDQGYKDANGDKASLDAIKEQNATLTQENSKLISETNLLTAQVSQLTGERDSLVVERDSLDATLTQNRETINTLNAQIVNLNAQIASLNDQILTNLSGIAELNTRISDLQKTIAFYEQFVVQFETDDQALVTFEFAGSVYDGKVVNKGDHVTTNTPASTEYIIFNGWMLDGEPIDLSTFVVTESVRIVADVTYKYIVNFNVENTTKSSQIVEKGQFATEPAKPKKNGFTFKYWTLDGEHQVDVSQYAIMANTTFLAKFVELYTVTFEVDGQTVANRRIERGATTTSLVITPPEGKVFNGWLLNGVTIDVSHYKIMEDTHFIADLRSVLTVKYEVTTIDSNSYFKTETFATQQVAEGTAPAPISNPSYTFYTFLGWSTDGSTVIDLNYYRVTEDTTFKAVMRHRDYLNSYTVTFYTYNMAKGPSFTVAWGQKIPMPSKEVVYPTYYPGSDRKKIFYGWSLLPFAQHTGQSTPTIFTETYAVTADITLYPVYVNNSFII